MQYVEVMEFPGLDSIKENISYYKQKFLDSQILAFRNAHADFAMQEEITKFFGDHLGWYPNSTNSNPSDYIEDHHKHMMGSSIAKKDEWMLGWHIEWVELENDSFRGSTWNMTKFDCEFDTGNTCFFDMTKFYNRLSDDEKDFLDKCTVKLSTKGNDFVYEYVKEHWITKEKTLRTFLGDYGTTKLFKFNGQNPTEKQIEDFAVLHGKIIKVVWEDKEPRLVHQWQKGDLLIPDLFKLAHAVHGGFGRDQRQLNGMFTKANPWGARQG
jgi:alpha-ketoglutarate-dependent taurine dioxygenase